MTIIEQDCVRGYPGFVKDCKIFMATDSVSTGNAIIIMLNRIGRGGSHMKSIGSVNHSDAGQLIPLDEVNGFKIRPGYYELMGANVLSGGVNFTVETKEGTGVELLLFHRKENTPYATIPFPKDYRIGCVYSMIVFDLDVEEFEYAYRVDGPYDPSKGLLFDKRNILLDPYARAVTGQSVWGTKEVPGCFYKARVVKNNFDWGKNLNPLLSTEDVVIYELHVRGFTMDPSSGVKTPGTFSGIREKIPYLKELGVTAVELMPIFEFDEMRDAREVDGEQLLDYWGYNPISFFAPNTSYSSGIEYNREGLELKQLIKALNNNGIEVYLDVVFNHTAEGNENGPTFSFKGFDNRIYYILMPGGYYYNFSGCGNTLNCNHPMVQKMIRDCLRYWTIEYRVDGFRFDLASILGRGQNGAPLSNPPILEDLAGDPILSNVKLIAEAWDAGGLYQVGTFPSWKRWAEWNGRYRDDMRDYLKGDITKAGQAALRVSGSPDLYPPAVRGTSATVNFLNCHDGFTLWDMYSYNEKHNEKNGWNNTDGANDNRSWNCGVEGPTDDPTVLELRRKLCMNAVASLMMSRGIPMIYAGDEFLNSQDGNNNAYCQDNAISWLNWNDLQKNREHFEFTKFMIRFRRAHKVIRKSGRPSVAGFPDLMVIRPGQSTKVMGVVYAGRDDDDESDDIVGIAFNVYWEPQMLWMPQLPDGLRWYMTVDTSGTVIENKFTDDYRPYRMSENLEMPARSVIVFLAK